MTILQAQREAQAATLQAEVQALTLQAVQAAARQAVTPAVDHPEAQEVPTAVAPEAEEEEGNH